MIIPLAVTDIIIVLDDDAMDGSASEAGLGLGRDVVLMITIGMVGLRVEDNMKMADGKLEMDSGKSCVDGNEELEDSTEDDAIGDNIR